MSIKYALQAVISLYLPFHLSVTFFANSRVVLQEGFARLWRGTNAGLALAVPTVGSKSSVFLKH